MDSMLLRNNVTHASPIDILVRILEQNVHLVGQLVSLMVKSAGNEITSAAI